MQSKYTYPHLYRFFVLGMLLISLTLFWGCDPEEDEPDPIQPANEAGALVEAAYLISFTPEQAQALLAMYGAPVGLTLTHSAAAYRIEYKTRDKNGELIDASGAMFLPLNLDTLDLVSVQHGTALKRDRVGSENPLYAIDAALFAMSGYMAVSPDYIGLGVSESLHPYLHAELTTNAVVDLLRAARTYASENALVLSDELFLAGYSEGGYATLAAQKYIEANYTDEFQLTAVAPMSGPYDLLGSTRALLSRENYDIPAFLAYVVVAYDDIYEWNRLADIFNAPYAAMLPALYDGNLALEDVNDELPTAIDSLFKPDFISAFFAGEETEIQQALADNSLLEWGPIAPVRMYHGTADSTVSINNTLNAFSSMQANGGTSVELVTLLGADHLTGFFPSMILAKTWFDSIRVANN